MKAGLAVVVAVASASVNTHVKVETVNFDEDQLNTEKNITETFAWKEEGPGEGEEEVLDLTKLNNNKLNTFWEELTKNKELVLENEKVFQDQTNYIILVRPKGERSRKLGAGFSLKYDENKNNGEPSVSVTYDGPDMTTTALGLYAMVSWVKSEKATKEYNKVKIQQSEKNKYNVKFHKSVSETLRLLNLEAGKTVNEWYETLAELTALPSKN